MREQPLKCLARTPTLRVPSCQRGPLAVQDEAPLQLYMHGVDLYMNSHFDVWIVDIDQWRPGPIDEQNWRVPDFCHQGEVEELQRHQLDSSLAMEVAKQLPNLHFGDKLYDAFVHRHGRRHVTRNEYDQRTQRFYENKQMIEVSALSCSCKYNQAMKLLLHVCEAASS